MCLEYPFGDPLNACPQTIRASEASLISKGGRAMRAAKEGGEERRREGRRGIW